MDLSAVTPEMIINLSLLLLIGIGPKIALVPFLEKTKNLNAEEQREVGTRMVKTAIATALVLFAAGALLMRLLHISSGAVGIAGGIVLLLLALKMVLGSGKEKAELEDSPVDHHQMAVYPLAIPFLLNPVGIAVLIVASSEVGSILAGAVVVGLVLLVGAFDWVVFRNMDKLSKRLNPSTLIISEIVFGILLMALAVELVVWGLAKFGIIDLIAHH
jgi:small neutral amino acid transporter SnatA (MarC family)